MATHPVIHDDPDCPPNRCAFALTGPSQHLRCWFGKGTQVSISTELFADVPLLFLPLDWSSSGVSSPDGGLVPIVFALLWVHSCRVSFDRVSFWTCGSQKGTQHDDPGCVCVLFVPGLAVWM